ncbi:MAG: hypothetical protein WC785_05970 [Tatlockia sp.]|jgi:hypothetical protein
MPFLVEINKSSIAKIVLSNDLESIRITLSTNDSDERFTIYEMIAPPMPEFGLIASHAEGYTIYGCQFTETLLTGLRKSATGGHLKELEDFSAKGKVHTIQYTVDLLYKAKLLSLTDVLSINQYIDRQSVHLNPTPYKPYSNNSNNTLFERKPPEECTAQRPVHSSKL